MIFNLLMNTESKNCQKRQLSHFLLLSSTAASVAPIVPKQPLAMSCMAMRRLQDINGFPASNIPYNSCATRFICGQHKKSACGVQPIPQAGRK